MGCKETENSESSGRDGGYLIIPVEAISAFQTLSAGALRVLFVLAKYANNETGECWPGVRTITDLARINSRDTKKRISELVDAGLVAIVSIGKGKRTTTYRVLLPQADERSAGNSARTTESSAGNSARTTENDEPRSAGSLNRSAGNSRIVARAIQPAKLPKERTKETNSSSIEPAKPEAPPPPPPDDDEILDIEQKDNPPAFDARRFVEEWNAARFQPIYQLTPDQVTALSSKDTEQLRHALAVAAANDFNVGKIEPQHSGQQRHRLFLSKFLADFDQHAAGEIVPDDAEKTADKSRAAYVIAKAKHVWNMIREGDSDPYGQIPPEYQSEVKSRIESVKAKIAAAKSEIAAKPAAQDSPHRAPRYLPDTFPAQNPRALAVA